MKNNIMLVLLLMGCVSVGCSQNASQQVELKAARTVEASDFPEVIKKVKKSTKEWRKELTEMEYYVLREQGTERAFTGDLWNYKGDCIYTCAGCGLPLFDSDTKFKSGTGWPSYYEPIKPEYVLEKNDISHGMVRTEVVCARCGGHLGHVFNDGPNPTGLRYCINSVSLDILNKETAE